MAYEISERVAFKHDLPEFGLWKGDIATVTERRGGELSGYSLEVFNAVGESITALTVTESEIEPLSEKGLLHFRKFDEAYIKKQKRKEKLIERYAFGVMADKEEMPKIFSHSDRFLIIDMKDRKEIIREEYRPNPYGEICRTKYPIPTDPGEGITEEELEIYRNLAEILKDCDTTIGYNLGYFPSRALEKTTFYVMQSVPVLPRDHIKELFEIRAYYGDYWHRRND